MARMIYKYKDYYFESDDRTVMVTQAEYFLFVDKCRKVIEEDGFSKAVYHEPHALASS